jgi:hypothetical protein
MCLREVISRDDLSTQIKGYSGGSETAAALSSEISVLKVRACVVVRVHMPAARM